MIFFEDDAAAGAGGDVFFHPLEFFFEEIAEGGEGVLSEEKEALGNAGPAEFPTNGEEAPEATAVFVDVGGEGAVFFFLAFDADGALADGNAPGFERAMARAEAYFIEADPDGVSSYSARDLYEIPQGQILDLETTEAEISFVDLTSNEEEE